MSENNYNLTFGTYTRGKDYNKLFTTPRANSLWQPNKLPPGMVHNVALPLVNEDNEGRQWDGTAPFPKGSRTSSSSTRFAPGVVPHSAATTMSDSSGGRNWNTTATFIPESPPKASRITATNMLPGSVSESGFLHMNYEEAEGNWNDRTVFTPDHQWEAASNAAKMSQYHLPDRGFDGLSSTPKEQSTPESSNIPRKVSIPHFASILNDQHHHQQQQKKRQQQQKQQDLPHGTFIQEEFVIEESAEDIIADLKLQLETLITAVMLAAPRPTEALNSSMLQGADAIEIAHRIMTRVKVLRDENKRLYKLVSGTLCAQHESTIVSLQKENETLRKHIEEIAQNTAVGISKN